MYLSLYNSLIKKKEPFSPIDTTLVKMYVCGPTVYDRPHIGNARSVVAYDILYRILIKLFGFDHVRYVRNITDIDDKIIKASSQKKIPVSELTKNTINSFHEDMDYLGCKRPNIEPKATDHIKEMIEIINILIIKGIAYKTNGHIYFDITKFQDYNKLSRRSSNAMLAGTRVKLDNTIKRHPGDFVLWKLLTPGSGENTELPIFESPFGLGRPGWHIECSAMIHKHLGSTFDIHGGGVDLIFPHHTNEIAQSCSAFPESKFAKFWVHNGFLTVNKEKMSKSLGNFITVYDLRNQGIPGEVIRLFLLNNYYRKPLDYNKKAISDSKKMLSYWYGAIQNLPNIEMSDGISKEFFSCLLNDINTSNAIKVINEYAKQVYSENSFQKKTKLASGLLSCSNFLGLMKQPVDKWFKDLDQNQMLYIDSLLKNREMEKKRKNWRRADDIRQELKDMSISVEDGADGRSNWKKL